RPGSTSTSEASCRPPPRTRSRARWPTSSWACRTRSTASERTPTMKTFRKSPALLVLAALAAAGCILTSGQFVAHYALPDSAFNTGGTFQGEIVDLNTIREYNDHKQDLKLVGDIRNNGATAVQVEAWIVPAATTPPIGVVPDAVKLWGPISVPAGST